MSGLGFAGRRRQRGDSMSASEVRLRREQMGRAAGALLRGGPSPILDLGAGYWIAQSGIPNPDLNMTLVSSGRAATVADVLRKVTASGVPTLLMLAGDSATEAVVEPWRHVGEMPFMTSALDAEHLIADHRVRRAGHDDRDAICRLMAEAYRHVAAVLEEAAERSEHRNRG